MKILFILFITFFTSLESFCQPLSEYEKGLILLKAKRFQEAYSIFKTNENDDVRCAMEVGKLIYHGQIKFSLMDMEESFIKFSELDKKGNKEASVFKGMMLLYGIGCVADEEAALNIFRSALRDNNFYAYNMVGYMFFNGTYLKKDIDSSLLYLTKSKKYGDTKCYSRLAQIYASGIPGKFPPDSVTAKNILMEGCRKGDSYSCSGLASYDFKKLNKSNHRTSNVIDNLNNAIDYGENPLALNMLLMLLEDEELNDIPKLKFSKYDKTTLLNELINVKNSFDSYNISLDYINIKPNKDRALYFLKRAEIANCPEAFVEHGGLYLLGNSLLGISKDLDSAKFYFEIATKYGMLGYSNSNLGYIYLQELNSYIEGWEDELLEFLIGKYKLEEGETRKITGKDRKEFRPIFIQKCIPLLDKAIKALQIGSKYGIEEANDVLCEIYKTSTKRDIVSEYIKQTGFNFIQYCKKNN